MNRRSFIQSSVAVIGASSLQRLRAETAPVKTTRTSVLEIGYHDIGDPSGFPVILLHGFPDDVVRAVGHLDEAARRVQRNARSSSVNYRGKQFGWGAVENSAVAA